MAFGGEFPEGEEGVSPLYIRAHGAKAGSSGAARTPVLLSCIAGTGSGSGTGTAPPGIIKIIYYIALCFAPEGVAERLFGAILK